MNLPKLIETIQKEHVSLQSERQQIHKLNIDLSDEIQSTFKLIWAVRNQRYLCDKLNINGNEYLDLINELNQIDNIVFIEGHRKFGSSEIYLSELLQYLRGNPKSVSYLLFYAEKSCAGFLDPLSKIVLSTVYSHCHINQDKTAIVDLIEELLDIYINFYKDIRRQIHAKSSSFCLIYRNFCDELPELKTFYKLALYQPIMQVLSEDNLFLDVDSARAAMRFYPKEREKHFGIENTQEYHENLVKYKKWTLQKLKMFITNFINSLRSNIFAFPQSLAAIIIRIYSKLIEHHEFQKVYAICIDLIFCFLICPAVQNPDLFGITDLHVNHISHYNLLQCAQIIQLLALSKWETVNSTYKEVCDLFDKDCLSFVIDHILGIFNNYSLPKSIESTFLPHFLISEFELKLFLEYIKIFLEQDDHNDIPVKTYFNKLSDSIINFEFYCRWNNSESLSRKSKLIENEFNNGDLVDSDKIRKIILSQNEDFLQNYKLLFVSRNILQIMNDDVNLIKMVGMMKEKDFISKFKEKRLVLVEQIDLLWSELESICIEDRLENTNETKLNNSTCIKNDSKIVNELFKYTGNVNNLADLTGNMDYLNMFDNRQIDRSFKEDMSDKTLLNDTSNFSDMFTMQSLGNLSLNFKENEPNITDAELVDINQIYPEASGQLIDIDSVDCAQALVESDPIDKANANVETPKETGQLIDVINMESSDQLTLNETISKSTSQNANVNKKGFFSLSNFKNIKDKVKNISIKENRLRPSASDNFNNLENISPTNLGNDLSKERFDVANVKAKTNEILEKYKTNKVTNDLNCTEVCQQKSLIDIGDEVDHYTSQPVDQFRYVKNKLIKLMCLINISSTYQNYRFLDLTIKTNFVMLLKILLSQARNVDEVSNSVLLLDMIRVMEDLSENDFVHVFQEIETDLKSHKLFTIYLMKSREYLLFRLQAIRSMQMTLRKEQYITNFIIVSFLVRQLMEKKESAIQQLMTKIGEASMLADEKVSSVENLLQNIVQSNECRCLTDDQYSLAKQIIERHLIGRIYLYVFYSNGDIDKMRDQILNQQISQLSKTITPSSKLLKIPAKYFSTAPWTSAQAELLLLSAYKTPRDKVQCIHRCCSHIITLLSTSDNTIPSADDLLPVLIFVAIQANPMAILSTIQYVNSYHSKELIGEEAYYWTQFCSVVEFTKTILNQQ